MNPHARKSALILAAVCVALAGSALAQPQGADAVKPRQSNLKAMGKDFKIAGDQLKSDKPDLATVKNAAVEVKGYADLLPSWFPKGSGPETGLKMQAKAVIWTDPKRFAAAAQDYKVQAAKFAALTASSSDLTAIRAQFKATGHTCGACHDTFREKE